MPLRIPDPPEQGMRIIREALSSAINQPSAAAFAIAEAGPENLTTAGPHQIFFVGLSDIAEGRFLDAARAVGWRYIIFDAEQPLAAAELKIGDDEGAVEFSNINRGPFAASTVEGVARAESLPVVRDNDFELRVIEIPALYVVTLWLHGDQDIIIPLPPTRPELESLALYGEEEVVGRLRKTAQERLKFDERPLEPGTA